MRNVWLVLLVLSAACGSKDEAEPRAKAKQADASVVARTPPVDAPPAPPDAQTAPAGTPVDLATLPVLGAPGPEGPAVLYAADAPLSYIRRNLADYARTSLIEVSTDVVVTGRFGPTTREHAVAVLDAGVTGHPSRSVRPKGKGVKVELSFAAAKPQLLFRFLGNILEEAVVVAVEDLPAVDIRVRSFPAAALMTLVSERLGLVVDRHGKVMWIRRADGARLDPALLRRKGPTVSVLAVGARAGELYALLSRVDASAGGGAACDAGPAITVQLRDAPLGTALAVIAALSGEAPAADRACVPDATATSLDDTTIHAIVEHGTERAAALRHGGAPAIAVRGDTIAGAVVREVGADLVYLDVGASTTRPLALYPEDLLPRGVEKRSVEETRDLLARARLAATCTGSGTNRAIFELADGEWVYLGQMDVNRFGPAWKVLPGKVTYEDAAGAPAEAVLRKRP